MSIHYGHEDRSFSSEFVKKLNHMYKEPQMGQIRMSFYDFVKGVFDADQDGASKHTQIMIDNERVAKDIMYDPTTDILYIW